MGGKTVRWLRLRGDHKQDIGNVLQGFLKLRSDLGSKGNNDSCPVTPQVVDGGRHKRVTFFPAARLS